jgi:predicted transcriptional regulator
MKEGIINSEESLAASPEKLLDYTVKIVSSYLSNNTVPSETLNHLIRDVYHSLTPYATETSQIREEQKKQQQEHRVKETVTEDYLTCLEDGKQVKMLRRYLKKNFQMTPEDYRKKWDLPYDYPMVAPNYTKKRSKLALEYGLGKKREG